MNKTIRNNFNGKFHHTVLRHYPDPEFRQLPGLQAEINTLRQAANDLLSPRPEAICRLLQMSRELNQA